MAKASDVLSLAKKQLGKKGKSYWEAISGTPFVSDAKTPWCAAFVSWTMKNAGQKVGNVPFLSCTSFFNATRKSSPGSIRAAKNSEPGDIVLFDWDKSGDCDHVGLVESNTGSYLVCIEGNAGGCVSRRNRDYAYVRACVKPGYSAGKTSSTSKATSKTQQLAVDGVLGICTISALQKVLNEKGYKDCIVDGIMGYWTRRELQRYLKSKGHDLVIDGVFGKYSTTALQKYLRGLGYRDSLADGSWGAYTTRALQKALNAGRF